MGLATEAELVSESSWITVSAQDPDSLNDLLLLVDTSKIRGRKQYNYCWSDKGIATKFYSLHDAKMAVSDSCHEIVQNIQYLLHNETTVLTTTVMEA